VSYEPQSWQFLSGMKSPIEFAKEQESMLAS
jgi:hypothetical protein